MLCAACGAGHKGKPYVSPRPGWSARMQLTIDLGAAELYDFPVPIRLSPERLAPASYAIDGHDLRFTDQTGVDLAYDIESITPQHGAMIWVRVPHLAGPTKITLYYGSKDALLLDGSEARSVWKHGYTEVLHCIDESNDVSPHQNPTTTTNTNPADGVFGQGLYFGTSQVDAVTSQVPVMTGDRTLCAWVKPGNLDGQARIAGVKGFSLDREGAAVRCGAAIAKNVLAIDTWKNVCCVHHANTDALVVDGASVGKPTRSAGVPDRTFELGGAHGEPAAKRFTGALDEVRVSDTARGLPWLMAETMTRGEVVTFGAPEKI
ncbi:MAG: DUF2341 domain-containing protein [Kofleriaceae bacterium]